MNVSSEQEKNESSEINQQSNALSKENNIKTKETENQPSSDPAPAVQSVTTITSSSQPESSTSKTDQTTNKSANINNANTSSPGTSEEDGDFEPTVGMMINDFDDERTMDEEENYEEDSEEDLDELDDLNKESDMPLEELLATYRAFAETSEPAASTGVGIFENAVNGMQETEIDENGEGDKRALRSAGNITASVSDSNSDDEDYDSPLNDDWKKKPRIGEEFQVHWIPTVQSASCSTSVDDLEVWNPEIVNSTEVENYLKEISEIHKQDSMFKLPMGTHTPDNEDALLLLKQCNNNTAEALRRYRSRPKPLLSELNVWSEEECLQFEIGLAIYGKDFHTIHQNKVKTKSVRDIVKFYYIWKKTERYDHFTAKTRLGKKKEPLHPGVTDYMERLLDENDQVNQNNTNVNDDRVEYPTAPHTNALREYIRNNYTSEEYPPTFPAHMTYEHLEMIDRDNLQSTHSQEAKSNHHYMDIETSKSHTANINNSSLIRTNNGSMKNNATIAITATADENKTESERTTENITASVS